jgi:hypothetical protein
MNPELAGDAPHPELDRVEPDCAQLGRPVRDHSAPVNRRGLGRRRREMLGFGGKQ